MRFLSSSLCMGLIFAALPFTGCETSRVAGTSSGVDNPQLSVAFSDSTGIALRVTGDLNLFGADQNPAVDPQPLWTIKLKGTSLTNLTGDDIDRIPTSSTEANPQALNGDSTFAFNLQLKTEDRLGVMEFGLVYNPATRGFTRLNGDSLGHLVLEPQPLVQFISRISLPDSLGSVGRVFIPGSPFQATLVGNEFIFEDLPPGTFTLRLLDGDGKVFPVTEPLDSHRPGPFTPGKTPLGQLNPQHNPGPDSGFSINTSPPREAFLESPVILEANMFNIDPGNPGLSVLWRQISQVGDSSITQATIFNPTRPRTQVQFHTEGAYLFEVAITLGLNTQRDTLVVSVRRAPPPPRPRIIQPRPNEVLVPGQPYNIMWEMPLRGPVTVRFSANGGATWNTLAEHFVNDDSLPIFNWTPPQESIGVMEGLIQVRLEVDTLQTATSEAFFSIQR